jgi:uncharacterized membrane protein
MGIIHILLRLVHIVAAFAWIGMGFTVAAFFDTALATASPENRQRMAAVFYTRSKFGTAIPVAALLTVGAGLLLYIVSNSASYFSSTGNMVLGTGALAGLLAFGHGAAVTGPLTTRYTEALARHVREGQPLSPEHQTELEALRRKHSLHTRISLALAVFALIGMASARYL